MSFDIQAPGVEFLIIVPALIVVAAGLLLRRVLNGWLAGAIAALLPGIVLVVLTLIDERRFDMEGLTRLPFGWSVWTALSAPGTLLGLLILLLLGVARRRRARRH
jgi:hypothetical protein